MVPVVVMIVVFQFRYIYKVRKRAMQNSEINIHIPCVSVIMMHLALDGTLGQE